MEISPVTTRDGRAQFKVHIRNLSGHKFPTAYPSRRAWLHVTVRDSTGKLVFESGALRPDGAIVGNDNDEDAQRFEVHHDVIRSPTDVQIYEAIMVDADKRVTTPAFSEPCAMPRTIGCCQRDSTRAVRVRMLRFRAMR